MELKKKKKERKSKARASKNYRERRKPPRLSVTSAHARGILSRVIILKFLSSAGIWIRWICTRGASIVPRKCTLLRIAESLSPRHEELAIIERNTDGRSEAFAGDTSAVRRHESSLFLPELPARERAMLRIIDRLNLHASFMQPRSALVAARAIICGALCHAG